MGSTGPEKGQQRSPWTQQSVPQQVSAGPQLLPRQCPLLDPLPPVPELAPAEPVPLEPVPLEPVPLEPVALLVLPLLAPELLPIPPALPGLAPLPPRPPVPAV